DVERLYTGFATALHRLLAYQHLYIARLDAGGALERISAFGARGRPSASPPAEPDAAEHPWFSARGALLWRRGESEAPAFLPDTVRYAAVVPMRPKGQMLGVAVVALPRAIRADQVHIVEQAVEQLSLALDGAVLYEQATARASHIQALSNLARIVASVVNLREAFAAFSEEVRWLIPFDRAVMFLLDETERMVEPYATYPEEGGPVTLRSLAGSIASVPIGAGAAVTFQRDDPRYAGLDWDIVGPDAREVAAVAVRQGGRTSAVFALVSNGGAGYSPAELDALEEVAGLLAVTIERLRLYERADHSAKHDLLTGLPNYRYLQERLAGLHAGIDAPGESAVIVADMDNLKAFNDMLGHEVGDRVIEIVARELRATCRPADMVARTGGDEFVVVVEGAGEDMARAVAERIHAALEEAHREIVSPPARIGVSLGIAVAPGDAQKTPDLLQAADRAMYEAKFAGGQRTRTVRERGADARPGLRGRGLRLPEILVRIMTAGAAPEELEAIENAHRWMSGILMRLGTAPELVPQVRMLVTARAMQRIVSPRRDADRSLARRLVGRIYHDWWLSEENGGREAVEQLIPGMVEVAWLAAAEPYGRGMTVAQALEHYVQQFPESTEHPNWPIITDVVLHSGQASAEAA
ncbi:MAG: diguanylate cyclase, partial [Dehalococcoidia bacterium]